jgi:hypothetical protein
VFGAGAAVGFGQVHDGEEVAVGAADDLLGDGPGEDLDQVGVAGIPPASWTAFVTPGCRPRISPTSGSVEFRTFCDLGFGLS